jgi:hypothetical protein
MPLLKIEKLTDGLSQDWSGFLRDWDRALRAGNYPETTRYNYLLAAAQPARYLAEYSPDPDADDAATDPTVVTKGHAEAFQAWMVETRSASTDPGHPGRRHETPTRVVPRERFRRSA